MASTSPESLPLLSDGSRPLRIYYGPDCHELLPFDGRVVLQPDQVTDQQLDTLLRSGVEPLAYISLGEDHVDMGPWLRPTRNPEWGGRHVNVGHPEWRRRTLQYVRALFNRGFMGLMLDTLDTVQIFPEDRDHMLWLIRRIGAIACKRYLLANRGFELLPEMVPHVDGVLFESFSSTWTSTSYAPLPDASLEINSQIARYLQGTGLDLYALDYADSPELAEFARRRARQFRLQPLVGNKLINSLRTA